MNDTKKREPYAKFFNLCCFVCFFIVLLNDIFDGEPDGSPTTNCFIIRINKVVDNESRDTNTRKVFII